MTTFEQFSKDVKAAIGSNTLADQVIKLATNGVSPIAILQATNADSAISSAVSLAQAALTAEMPRSKFVLGSASMKELQGVNNSLVRCVQLAMTLTGQDFCVYDGLRTIKEQAAAVKAGNSQTMQSKHLQGLAVDLVPWIGGKPVWDWKGCYQIAYAMDLAATSLGFAHNIRWGGAWDRTLSDFGSDLGSYEQESKLYMQRHAGSDFLDGPHFEWVS